MQLLEFPKRKRKPCFFHLFVIIAREIQVKTKLSQPLVKDSKFGFSKAVTLLDEIIFAQKAL